MKFADNEKRRLIPLNANAGTQTFLYAIIFNLAVQFIIAIILEIIKAAGTDLSKNAIFNLLFMIVLQVSFFTAFYLCIIKSQLRPVFCVKNKFNYKLMVLTPFLAALCILCFYAPTYWFALLLDKMNFSASGLSLSTPVEFVLGSFVLIILAPFVEELIFRSALLSGLRTKVSVNKAVILTAFAFMVMHMNPAQSVYQFLLGIVLGYSVVLTGSPLMSMLIHSFSNLFAMLLDYTALKKILKDFIIYLGGNIFIAIAVSLAFIIICGFLIFIILKYCLNKKDEKTVKTVEAVIGSRPVTAPPVFTDDGSGKLMQDTGIPNEPQNSAVSLDNNKNGVFYNLIKSHKTVYWLTNGICIFMWLVTLISGIVS